MGCDIHTVWQKRDGHKWVDVPSDYDESRNYSLFGILAGVRGDGPPIVEPRGYPSDFEVGEDNDHPTDIETEWREDGRVWVGDHTHSWLMSDEMIEWYEANDSDIPPFVEPFFHEVIRLHREHGMVRLVFGFDN